MKYALVTAHNDAYKELTDLTWEQNKKLYAEKWGYGAFAKTDGFRYPVKQMGFDRIEFLTDLLELGNYDWIHVSGGDTMITNFTIPVSDIADNDYDFVIATDVHNINNDSFLARNTPLCINWLKNLISIREKYVDHSWYDQQAMIDTIDMLGDKIKIVPQRTLNSYDYDLYPKEPPHVYKKDLLGNDGQWQPGDFLFHMPDIKMPIRLEKAKYLLTQVVK